MKKFLIITLVLLLALIVSTSVFGQKKVKIVFMSKWSEGEVIQGIMKDFISQYMKDNPNVTVEANWAGRQVNVPLMASIQAGNPPDIYDEDPHLINESLGKAGLALPLDDYVAKVKGWNENKVIKDLYAPGFLEPWKYEGKLYTMPYMQFVSVFWYNKTMFKKLGITKLPNTWSEFLSLCETLKKKGVPPLVQDGGINFYNLYYYSWLADRLEGPGAFRKAIYDKTGKSWDKPGFLKAAKLVRELYDKGYFIKGFEGYQWPAGQIDWAQGVGALMLNHTYLPIEVADAVPDDFVFGAFPVPAVEGGKGKQYEIDSIVGGSAILKSSKNPDVAIDFIKRFMSVEFQQRLSTEANNLPTRPGVPLPEIFADLEGIFAKQTGAFDAYAGGPGQMEPEYNLTVLFPLDDQLIFGKITPEKFIEELKKQSIAYWKRKG